MMSLGQHERPLIAFTALSSVVFCIIVLWSGPWSTYVAFGADSLVSDISEPQTSSFNALLPVLHPVPFGNTAGLGHEFSKASQNEQRLTKDLRLVKRSEEVTITYEVAKCKGAQLLQAMAGPGRPSQYTDFKDLIVNGWMVHYDEAEGNANDMLNAFATLGLSDVDRPGTRFANAIQSEDFTKDDQVVKRPTGAYYQNQFSTEDGYIVAQSNFSPEYMNNHFNNKPGDTWVEPDLSRWSDVAWLIWEQLCADAKTDPADLKYVFRSKIINPNTNFIVDTVAGIPEGGKFDLPWPGKSFSTTTDDGQALLGTPNGCGVAWFLITHPNAFAGKRVQKVGIFSIIDDDNGMLQHSMWFQIG